MIYVHCLHKYCPASFERFFEFILNKPLHKHMCTTTSKTTITTTTTTTTTTIISYTSPTRRPHYALHFVIACSSINLCVSVCRSVTSGGEKDWCFVLYQTRILSAFLHRTSLCMLFVVCQLVRRALFLCTLCMVFNNIQ